MHALEAVFSFLILVSFSSFLLISSENKLDTSLYMYELQGDVKNVLYLKGGFENIDYGNLLVMEIYNKTGLCIEMEQTDLTSYLVSPESVSSSITIPKLKPLSFKINSTKTTLKNSNLTGFVKDKFFFGKCKKI